MKAYNGFSPEQRTRADQYIKAEIAAYRLTKPTECQACQQREGVIDYHAEDYTEPFGPHVHAYQLCFACHLLWHGRRHRPEGWKAYKEALRAGACFAPHMTRNIYALAKYDTPAAAAAAIVGYMDPRKPMFFDVAPFAGK